MPRYHFHPESGLWHHNDRNARQVMRLSEISYESGKLEYRSRHATEPETVLPGYLEEARKILGRAKAERREITDPRFTPEFEVLRWFPLPGEIQRELRAAQSTALGQKKFWDEPSVRP